MSAADIYDLLVIGGGINGAGIARDAAGRGLKVLLCEKGDLAGATSSASSKLIHGGLRYLEHYDFRLVRESLREREVLLRMAPHIIWPLRFVLPHDAGLRPAWMVRLGLFLYDHLGGRKVLPATRSLDLRRNPAGAALQDRFGRGFEYSDCWVEDSRLVVLNAMDAAERGAVVLTRTACISARRVDGLWEAALAPTDAVGAGRTVRARVLVNAAGPWVAQVLDGVLQTQRDLAIRLVKGSHIVVPQLFETPQAYILQNDDRRIVFAIPYERRYTLVGTTDRDFKGEPGPVEPDGDEVDYLCAVIRRYFRRTITPAEVVWRYAGVRPLYDDRRADVSAVTRDYVFDMDAGEGRAPLLSIFGGKITTYRRLAEHALRDLSPLLGREDRPWTASAPLPGGDMPGAGFEGFLDAERKRRPWLPAGLARRYARAYGTRTENVVSGAGGLEDLGEHYGGGLYAAEVDYLRSREWARTPEDVLWRRSKLGLHAPELANRLGRVLTE